MSVNSITRPEISNDTYMSALTGAAVGGLGTYGAMNAGLKHIAKGTTKAFGAASSECDSFVTKHNGLITRAVESKKGFFGKINKLLGKNVQAGDDLADKVSKATGEVIDGYRNKAAKSLSKKFSGEVLQESVDKLSNKKLTKDILKSYKNVTKTGRMLAVAGAVVLGTLGGCIANRLIKSKKETSAVNENKTTEQLYDMKSDASLGKTTAEYNREKREKKVKEAK